MNSCDLSHVDTVMASLRLVIYIPIFVFGLFLNSMALLVFCFQLRKWTESTIYMINLLLMDLLLLFALPFRMYNQEWSAEKGGLCSFLESLYFVSMYGSIYTITCISIDRYIGVCHPFLARQLSSPQKALMACLAVWVFVFGATTPVYSFHLSNGTSFRCFHGFSAKGWNPVLISCLEVFGFLLPAVVVVTCSLLAIRALNKSQQRSPKKHACIWTIYSSMVAFLVPFTPSHLAILLQFFVRNGTITDCSMQKHISMFVQVSMSLANITCCLDALCYYFVGKEVRDTRGSFSRSIRRRISKISDVELTGCPQTQCPPPVQET